MTNGGWIKPKVLRGILCTVFIGLIATVLLGMPTRTRFKEATIAPARLLPPSAANQSPQMSRKPISIGPTVYMITPTYPRSTQQPDLVRVSQSLMMSSASLHWIVVEDADKKTEWVTQLLQRTGLPFTHLNIRSSGNKKCRGVNQRNFALKIVEKEARDSDIIYFGDDDNSYDHRLFDEMAKIKKIGMAPTAGFPKSGLSTPVVKNGKIIALYDFWISRRKFPFDMACMSLKVGWWKSRGAMKFKCFPARMETKFLESLNATLSDMMPLASNATQIMVWHTKTTKENCNHTKLLRTIKKYPKTNLDALYSDLICGRGV